MNAVSRALSDPTRREVLRLLRERDTTAGEIADRFPLSRSTLSGHFNVLKHAGLIVAEKNGTSILYSLTVSVVEQALAAMLELLDVVKIMLILSVPFLQSLAPPHVNHLRQSKAVPKQGSFPLDESQRARRT